MIDDINYPDLIERRFEILIPAGQKPERLDIFLASAIANATRTKAQAAIEAGNVTLNGAQVKPSRKIQPGDLIICTLMTPKATILTTKFPCFRTPSGRALCIVWTKIHRGCSSWRSLRIFTRN